MATVSSMGFEKGTELDETYARSGNRVPMLHGFYLGYGVGDTTPPDNHLNMLMLLPGGDSQDLTPNAARPHLSVPDGRLAVSLRDRDPDSGSDWYFYRAAHALLPRGSRFQMRDLGAVGTVERRIPRDRLSPFPRLYALTGFTLYFTGGRDHHIDQLGVQISGDVLTVTFNDRNDDDVFGYLVDFVSIPQAGMNIATGSSSGVAKGADRTDLDAPPRAEFGITGFHFDYTTKDHHIRDVGVLRNGPYLDVYFGDRNGDDRFTWSVNWVHVSPQIALPVG
ncbi:hypothetical protein CFK38_07870 [Brachybacterium vulturis]|uniref:Uncharacterized protein n=1 Tax=Brachybacterium vulturis TaxID=2017484 RepID=A0A291GMK4_9MICO|nr:hypothetical protein [Brachybacterium vulturis]ATG51455.1 hypothetical protein CFK38_07870 [Brachybacterium vulturis]